MTLFQQVFLGSTTLVICALVHIALVALCIPYLFRLSHRLDHTRQSLRNILLLSAGVGVILLSHTAAIWIWTTLFVVLGAFDDFATSFYFATVSYTTLGYGDLVLGPGIRTFATFAATTGLLTFGISTALLIGLLTRLLPDVFRDKS
ncbi:MAG: ion channel [Pseudomonadota bacterium]